MSTTLLGKRKTCDGLETVNVDTLKVGKTRVNSEATVLQNVVFPDASGTLALTTDVPVNVVTTDTTQTVSGSKTLSAPLVISNATDSTSAVTGALQVAGGIYVGGNSLFAGKPTFVTTNGIPGGEAVRVLSTTSPYQTKLYSVNTAYDTSLYYPEFNGIDRLVSTASVDNLTNKSISGASSFKSTVQPYYRTTATNAGQEVGSGGITTLTFWTGTTSSQGTGITFNGNSTFTVAEAGMYLASVTCFCLGAGTGDRELGIRMGSRIRNSNFTPSPTQSTWMTVTACEYLQAGDTVYSTLLQNQGSNLTVAGNNNSSPFELVRLF
jgi:hypothetical protein